MFKVWHGLTPHVFSSLFVRNQSIHGHNTRQYQQFRVSKFRTEYTKRSYSCKGVRIWNMISKYVSIDCSFLSLKLALKKFLYSWIVL